MRQSKNRKTTRKLFFILVLFFCLTSAVIYFLIFSPFFRIKEIEIAGIHQIAKADILDIVQGNIQGKKFWLLPQDNVFLLNTEALSVDLKKNFVEFYEVKMSTRVKQKLLPTILHIRIFKRQTEAIICLFGVPTLVGDQEIFDNCFYVDQDGIAFKPAPQTQGSLILLAGVNYDIWLGAEAVKPHLLEAMTQIKKDLAEKIPDFSFDYFIIISSQELHLKTKQGWQIYFDAMGNIERQTEILKELLKKEIDKPENLEYIDLRIEERVYYKDIGMESD